MKVSDIMVEDVASVASEDTVAKAFSVMIDRSVHQLPIVDGDSRYVGMVFAKNLLSSNAQPTAKVKGYAVNTHALSPTDDVEEAAKMVVGSGNRALPVVEGGKLTGIVSETDIAQTAEFGHATVDEVMSGAVVVEEGSSLADALSKMRRHNISRLPVIDEKGILRGVVNILDAASIAVTPKERTSRSAGISGAKSHVKGDVMVKDIMRKVVSVERGTRMNDLSEHFRRHEEIVVVGDGRPMGIVTSKDALELILPKKDGPAIHISHLEDEGDKREIEEQLLKFVKKIQGKLGDIQSIVVYADKHRTRKYSVRCRLITAKGVINAKAVGYDPISASKELIAKLNSQIKADHTQKVTGRKHRESARKAQEEV
jgi:CBS domain-containing protein/ribosome-associated translation inhibitor RaiA